MAGENAQFDAYVLGLLRKYPGGASVTELISETAFATRHAQDPVSYTETRIRLALGRLRKAKKAFAVTEKFGVNYWTAK